MESEIFKIIETKYLTDEYNFPITLITLDRIVNIFDYYYWITIYIDDQVTLINKNNLINNNQIQINYPFLYKLHRNFKYCFLSLGYPSEEFLWDCFNYKYADDPDFTNYIIRLLRITWSTTLK